MTGAEIFKEVFLAVSFFAAGMSIIAGVYNVVDAVSRRSAHSYSLAAVRFGTASIIGILGWAIREAPGIPPDIRAVVYVASLAFIGFGLIGVLLFKEPRRQP